jgi:N-acyl-D-aspartate/D-glutamate deacylase
VASHDVVIRGGTVLDGTGGPARTADVAIDGATISEIGRVDGRGSREIDAAGAVVAPGWVDLHTHFDGQVTWDPYLTPSSWQGVTTVVMGNCGVGFAPVRPERHAWLVDLMEGVEDIPSATLHDGIDWNWESFPEYLDALDRMPRVLHVGAQVPHCALRGYVMGDRGADHTEHPTGDEIIEMGRLTAAAVEAGALGFTTSRTKLHRSADGRHTPTLTASRDELIGIAAEMGRTGKGVFELIDDLEDLDRDFALFRDIAAASGRPLSVSLAQRVGYPRDEYRRILALMEQAEADGLHVRGQVAPRPVAVIMSLEASYNPLTPSKTYQALNGRPLAERVAVLRQPDVKQRILDELDARGPGRGILERYSYTFELGDPPRYELGPDASIRAEAARRGITMNELTYDIMLSDDGRGMVFAAASNYLDGNLDAVREMLLHPLTVPGLGDAGAHCTMVCDASFPTYLLSYWGVHAPESERVPLELLVKRQCADTAAYVGLLDRGVIGPGYRADLNVIDLGNLAVGRPEMRYDLPAGGKRLVQQATGYVATLCNGQVTLERGEFTGSLPGKVARGAQNRPKS